jgi:hypothetical protein
MMRMIRNIAARTTELIFQSPAILVALEALNNDK